MEYADRAPALYIACDGALKVTPPEVGLAELGACAKQEPMSVDEHKRKSRTSVNCAILTVSDTRKPETDDSGRAILEALETAGHRVHSYEIIADAAERVEKCVRALVGDPHCEAIVLNGGTGLAPRDITCEAVAGLLDKRLDGFGELFRMLSYQEIGSAAMLSRALAGSMGSTAVFSVPGSTAACRLAMSRLIVPELGHIASLLAPSADKVRRTEDES